MARQHPSNHDGRTCPCFRVLARGPTPTGRPRSLMIESPTSDGQLLDLIPGRSRPGDDNADTSGDRTPFRPHAKRMPYHYTTRS